MEKENERPDPRDFLKQQLQPCLDGDGISLAFSDIVSTDGMNTYIMLLVDRRRNERLEIPMAKMQALLRPGQEQGSVILDLESHDKRKEHINLYSGTSVDRGLAELQTPNGTLRGFGIALGKMKPERIHEVMKALQECGVYVSGSDTPWSVVGAEPRIRLPSGEYITRQEAHQRREDASRPGHIPVDAIQRIDTIINKSMSIEDIIARLGEPAQSWTAPAGNKCYSWRGGPAARSQVLVVVNPEGEVIRIDNSD